MVFGFLCPCVSVLPWPSPLYWFLQRCSVLTVPVLGLTLAVTPLLISARVFGFLCPCIGSYLGRNLSLDFYNGVQFSLTLCWVCTLADTLYWFLQRCSVFFVLVLGSYLGCHPSRDDSYNVVRFSLSLRQALPWLSPLLLICPISLLGSSLGCHPSCDDFYNGVRFSLSPC